MARNLHITTCKMCVPLLLLLMETKRYIRHGGNIVTIQLSPWGPRLVSEGVELTGYSYMS